MSTVQFNTLPEEVCLNVFSYLNFKQLRRILPVCRLWQKLAEDPSLYKYMKFTNEDRLEATEISKLINGKSFLLDITLHNRRDSAQILMFVANNCSRLERVAVAKGTLTSVALKSLADRCRSITELCFDDCDFEECNLSYLSNLVKVRSFDFSDCEVGDFEEVAKLVEGFSLLEELSLHTLTIRGHARSHQMIPSRNDTLQRLSFEGHQLEPGDLREICSTRRRMLIFGVSYIRNCTGDDLLSVFQMRRLVWLSIRASKIRASVWEKAFLHQKLNNLRHLDLTHCTGINNRHMKLIGDAFPLLLFLNLSFCINIDDEGVTLLIESCSSSLRFLITRCLFLLRGSCLINVPRALPHLKLLDLEWCRALDGSYVSTLVQRMPQVALRWWNSEINCNRTCSRFDELRDGKEMKESISVKEAKRMYGVIEEV